MNMAELQEQVYEVIYYNPRLNRIKTHTFQLQDVFECLEWVSINLVMGKLGYEQIGEV